MACQHSAQNYQQKDDLHSTTTSGSASYASRKAKFLSKGTRLGINSIESGDANGVISASKHTKSKPGDSKFENNRKKSNNTSYPMVKDVLKIGSKD